VTLTRGDPADLPRPLYAECEECGFETECDPGDYPPDEDGHRCAPDYCGRCESCGEQWCTRTSPLCPDCIENGLRVCAECGEVFEGEASVCSECERDLGESAADDEGDRRREVA